MEHVANSDFFEEDEPIADVVAAYEHGPDGITTPPLPAGAVLVTRSMTYATTVTPRDSAFVVSQPQLLTA